MDYGTHAWAYKPLSALTSAELESAKTEQLEQREAITASIMDTVKEQEFYVQEAERQTRLADLQERLGETVLSLEQQNKNMQDFNVYMKGRAEEMKAKADSPVVATGNAISEWVGGTSKTIGDAGAGLTGGLGGLSQTLSNLSTGLTSGLAGIGIFAVVIIGLIIVVLVMARGF